MRINPICTIVDGKGHAPGVVFEIDDMEGVELINQGYACELTVRTPIEPDEQAEQSSKKHKKKK